MKYLFTTIDGVLNPIDNTKDYTPTIYKECIQNPNDRSATDLFDYDII
jgi:hypothetical protein